MKKIFFYLFCSLSLSLSAQFERYYGDETSTDEAFVSSAQVAGGDIYHFGYVHNNSSEGADFYLVKTDAQGQQVWQKQWDYTGMETPTKIVSLSNGNLLVLGYSYDKPTGKNYGYYAILDATGQTSWQTTPNSQTDIMWVDAFQATNGEIWLLGNYLNGTQTDMKLLKIDFAGTVLLNQNYPQTRAYKMLEKSNGDLIVGLNDNTNGTSIHEIMANGNWLNAYPINQIPESLLLQGDRLYVGDNGGNIEKYDNTYTSVWQNFANATQLLSFTQDGHILAGGGNVLSKLDSTDGTLLWESVPTGAAQFFEYKTAILLSPTQWAISGSSTELLGKDALLDLVLPQDGSSFIHYTFGTQGIDVTEYGNTLSTTTDGGFILGGDNTLGNGFIVPRIIKTDAQGNQAWITDAGLPNTNYSTWGVCNGNNGGYVAMGYYSDTSLGVFATKVDAQGVPQWTQHYNQGQNYIFGDIKPYPSGGYVIVATVKPTTGTYNTGIIRINDNGDTLWTRKFPLVSNNNNPFDFCITNNGSIVIAGRNRVCDGNGTNCYRRQWLMKVDANGSLLWEHPYFAAINDPLARFSSVVENPTNGDLYAYGFVMDINGKEDARLIHTNAQGDSLGQYVIQGNTTSPIRGYRVCLAPNNDLLLFGVHDIQNNLTSRKGTIRRLDANFNMLWDKYYGEQEGILLYDAEVLLDGSLVGFGSANRVNNYDYYLLKTDASGTVSVLLGEKIPFRMEVFPNPSKEDFIEIALKGEAGEKYQINLYNSLGQLTFSSPFETLIDHKLQVKDFAKGIYFVQIVDSKGRSLTKRVSVL